MKIFRRTYSVVLALLAPSLFVPVQAAAQQPSQSQRAIQVPPDLPPPVGEEMRVKGDDIDKGKKIHPKAGETPPAAR